MASSRSRLLSKLTTIAPLPQLPLATDHTDTRKAAVSTLRGLLANPEAAAPVGGDTPITAEYVQKALAALTIGEIVQLMGWADMAERAAPSW